MVTVDSTLLFAEWCGHCKTFKPEWEKFKKIINTQKGSNINVTFHEYENNIIDKNPTLGKINGKNIQGYPTIKITVSSGNQKIEYEYDGKRNANELLQHIVKTASKKIKI